MADQPPARNFREAVKWFRARVPITKEKWIEMGEAAQAKGFTIAGVAQLELVADVFKDLVKSLEKGEALDDFKKRVSAKLETAWGEDRPWHVENIFRTNLQRAYSHARHEQMSQPAVLRDRPFWRYSATIDQRTTEICRRIHGTVLPADDPWWRTHIPPLHFKCRGAKMALTREQAEALGIAAAAPNVDAMEGFGLLDEWEPDLSAMPAPLVKTYRRGQ